MTSSTNHSAAPMDDVIHKQKFAGMKDKSSILLNFIHSPQQIFHELSVSWPFKPLMVRKHSKNQAEPDNKENDWHEERSSKTFFNRGEYGIN